MQKDHEKKRPEEPDGEAGCLNVTVQRDYETFYTLKYEFDGTVFCNSVDGFSVSATLRPITCFCTMYVYFNIHIFFNT